jgi:AraC-like DNA-binding protein
MARSAFPLPARLVLDLRDMGIRSVPAFGRYDYDRARPGLPEHSHEGAAEICYLERGVQTYCVGGERFELVGGDLFLTLPGERHGTGGAPEEKGLLYWLTVLEPGQTGGDLLGLPERQGRALWRALSRPGIRHFRGCPALRQHLDDAIRAATSGRSPLAPIIACNRLVAFLLSVIDARDAGQKRRPAWRFERVIGHIRSHLDEPEELDVGRLAAVAKLSVSRFKAAFKEATGVPPAEFALRLRIEEARRLLGSSRAGITEIAFSLGFSSSQYFASAFKRLTGQSPREFRAGSRAALSPR